MESILKDLQERFAIAVKKRIKDRAERVAKQTPPRYDEVFWEGTAVLDALAGPPERKTSTIEIANVFKALCEEHGVPPLSQKQEILFSVAMLDTYDKGVKDGKLEVQEAAKADLNAQVKKK